MEAQTLNLVAMIHLMMLSLWGGVVATEAVIEVMPFRRRELHPAAIRLHYWIDLLVELPLVLAVVVTGGILLYLTDPLTPLHLVKLGLGGATVAVNLFCIVVVVRRGRNLRDVGDDGPLWRSSRVVLACFVVGLLFATGAAILGFHFALERLV
jgi:NADH:ubiquinone oxidoreductase subunit 5 (subunit L)/multisubunit Na+/H+ antiporter MnhA subunit